MGRLLSEVWMGWMDMGVADRQCLMATSNHQYYLEPPRIFFLPDFQDSSCIAVGFPKAPCMSSSMSRLQSRQLYMVYYWKDFSKRFQTIKVRLTYRYAALDPMRIQFEFAGVVSV